MFTRSLSRVAAAVAALGVAGFTVGPAAAYIDGFPPPDLTPHFDRVAELHVRDIISLDRALVSQKKAYKEVRICVGLRSVEFRRVEVTFASGPKHERTRRLRVKRIMKPGECTHSIKLVDARGRPQRVESLDFHHVAYVKSGVQPIVGVFMR